MSQAATVQRPVRRRRARGRVPKGVISLLAVLVLLAIWQYAGSQMNPILLSTPIQVFKDGVQEVTQGPLILDLVYGFEEMFVGLFFGTFFGILVGMLMGRFRVAEIFLTPYVNFFNATPFIVLIPLLIIWVGVDIRARILFISIVTLWPILLNTMAGFKNVRQGWVEVGESFGLTGWNMLRNVNIPAAIPFILTGFRISAGLAIIAMILSELEVSYSGLGRLMTIYGGQSETGHFLAAVIATSVFGLVNASLVKLIQAKWFPWIAATSSR